jgi:hypothetical protein
VARENGSESRRRTRAAALSQEFASQTAADGFKTPQSTTARRSRPDSTGSALIGRLWFQLEGRAIARSWGFESPLPHQPSLTSTTRASFGWRANIMRRLLTA